ncbi:MAG: homoserine O-acetyltransferase [Saprospiraceae bacterium]|nr:homoserine O-acetyltransferase [Saprospiraceae bacterium]
MPNYKEFNFDRQFPLESGESLSGFKLAYQTFGSLNADKSNVVWVIHALTANSDPTDWWSDVVGKDKVINPEEHFIVCANALGSHYGSTNPLSINPENGTKYYHDFPQLTNRDIVNTFIALKEYLGLESIHTLIGASLGGQQAMEWAYSESDSIVNLVLIATNSKHSAYGIAFNESQRLAIEADQTWIERKDEAGLKGLKAARSIALLSYRTSKGYNRTQSDNEEKLDHYRVSSYQRYQGDKLVNRFNAFSYWVLTKAMDSHNIGRNRGGIQEALSSITSNTTVIGIDSDVLFPVQEQKDIALHIPNSKYYEISSDLGHDGFLTESQKVSKIIFDTIQKGSQKRYLKVC